MLGKKDLAHLRRVVAEEVKRFEQYFEAMGDEPEETLGWLPASEFAAHAPVLFERDVLAPLRARGLWRH
jgi:hypothetical protein